MARHFWAALAAACVLSVAAQAQAVTLTDKVHADIRKGNSYYDKGEHDRALERYRSAGQRDSASAVPRFNAGDALYKLGKYQEGAQEFLKAASSSTDSVSALSYYNLGNAAFKSGDPRAAAEAYKRSLLIRPNDEDAKYNLEYAMRVLKQEQQQQKDQQDKNQQDKNQQDEQQQQQNQEQQQNQDQNQQQDQQAKQNQEQGGQTSGQGQITPDELKRILAAIDAADKETQQELLESVARAKRITDKDW